MPKARAKQCQIKNLSNNPDQISRIKLFARCNKFLFSINLVTTMNKKHFSTEEAKKIGEALHIDWSKFDVEQFRMGLDVELEHGKIDPDTDVTHDDPIMTGKIALAHLNEFPDYYTRLDKLEEEAKKFHKKQKTLK